MSVFVIIPAAGLGTRMAAAGSRPALSKQFFELRGEPILVHTLRRFEGCAPVSEIYIALRQKEAEPFRQRLAKAGLRQPVHIVEGGENRQQSVANALAAIQGSDQDIVLVHDAVRPLAPAEVILAVIAAAEKSGAAIAAVPAVDTVKQVERTPEGAVITATIPRERIVLAQTPQGFRLSLLRQAFAQASADGFTATDEASLLERSGRPVMVVMGSPRNLKITTPGDLALAEFYLQQE